MISYGNKFSETYVNQTDRGQKSNSPIEHRRETKTFIYLEFFRLYYLPNSAQNKDRNLNLILKIGFRELSV